MKNRPKAGTQQNNLKTQGQRIEATFHKMFGRTPLRERLDDILKEAMDLHRFTDTNHLQEELGDLLCSTLQCANEIGVQPAALIQNTLAKIERRRAQYQTLGRKKQVAILGGAFDPITPGHIKTAQFVLNSSRSFDEVWILPCYKHMNNKKMASATDRLVMCQIAVWSDHRIRVIDYEIKHKLGGETYYLLKKLQNEPSITDHYDLAMIIGMDNAQTFNTWVNAPELERQARFVIVPRKGIPVEPNINWFHKAPHMVLSPENDIPETSSTKLRSEIKKAWNGGKPAWNRLKRSGIIDPRVLAYIETHRLYQ